MSSFILSPDSLPEKLYDDYRNTAYLHLNANCGDRAANLLRGMAVMLGIELNIKTCTPIYENLGEKTSALSVVVAVDACDLTPLSLMRYCRNIERRVLESVIMTHDGKRNLEVEVLLFGDQVCEVFLDGESRRIPHPDLPFRPDFLLPLAHMTRGLLYPLTFETMDELLTKHAETTHTIRLYRD